MNEIIGCHAVRYRRLCYLVMTLMLLSGVSVTYQAEARSGSLKLPLYEVGSSVHVPFPAPPESLGIFTEDGSRSVAYQYTDHQVSIGYTATIMLDRVRNVDPLSSEEWISRTIDGILEVINGHVLKDASITVDGLPARYFFASMGIVEHQAISRTLVIYDHGRIHTWAMQDVPSITGDFGERVFLENIQRIRVDSSASSSLKYPPRGSSHDVYRLGAVFLPFPGVPRPVEVNMPPAATEALGYQASPGAPLYMGIVLTGLPRVADPAYTFLRGSRFEKELLDVGDVSVAGIEAKYHVIRELGAETRHTYTVAWSHGDGLYVWSIHGDHSPRDRSVRDKFFESLQYIEVR
ncbi:hypothetical protein [Ectothiorhodospira haloalkaliphila]|uniref:hypothetical protein n=2 Tax=Ectothiorhodospira haloalkaliphila TaxID=421628 RepID=UPI000FFBC2E8|nr:hypothetical protein [Ectothiorhodospira haloalkaliphila]